MYAALIFGSVLLVGCNNNDEATNDNTLERGMDNLEEGVREGVNDTQRAVEDVVDPNTTVEDGVNDRHNDNELFDDANRNGNGNGADFDVKNNEVDRIEGNEGFNGTDTRIINE